MVVAASGKALGGGATGTAASSSDRKPPLAPSAGHNVGGWGAEDIDDDRSEAMQVACDVQMHC